MRIWATGPMGAATRQPWKLQPVPPGLDEGPVDSAALAMLRVCEARPGDVDQVLAPLLGLGEHAGLAPVGRKHLQASAGFSAERSRWLLKEAAGFGRRVGPPVSLTDALVLVASTGVTSAPVLTTAWHDRGLTEAGLHPLAVQKLASLVYGLDAGFRVLNGEGGRWRTELVVARRIDDRTLSAAAAIRPALRAARMLTVTAAAKLAPVLTAAELGRLCETRWALSPDRKLVVDWQPKHLDWGVGRILAAAGPVRSDVIHDALVRWGKDGDRRNYRGWTPRTLDRYLTLSPLYAVGPGRTHALASDWCGLTGGDRDILDALYAVGSPAPRPALVEALAGMGYSDNAAKHLVAISPVVTPVERGLYVRVGT